MKLSFGSLGLPASGCLVLPVATGTPPGLDPDFDGALSRLIAEGRFTPDEGEVFDWIGPPGLAASRLLLVGIGDPSSFFEAAARRLGGTIVGVLEDAGIAEASVLLNVIDGAPVRSTAAAAFAAQGAVLRDYRFTRYRGRSREDDRAAVKALAILTPDPAAAEAAFRPLSAVADGVLLARDLVNEPSNILTPEAFVQRARALGSLGLEVEALDVPALEAIGAGSLLAVGKGSVNPPRLLVVRWRGAEDPDAPPVALVGKGVTFDTGGISIKPAAGMWDMRGDMAGGAAVLGAMAALAGRKARANVVGIVALAENAFSGGAFRPGDIVTSLSGRTIEVIDTDAEGRMVLMDALHYAADRFRPRAIVDIATLTGSIIRALGGRFSGLFATDDALAKALVAAGEAEEERLWRMPLDPYYDENLKSDIADLRQVAPDEASADAIHGAALLRHFVGDSPWAHIDTGKLTAAEKDTTLCPKGATGFAVRLFDRWIADTVEH
ncbi:leucyl aminopeptidase [Inquilinus sp. CAU 1745]|uniref:leucyl aminopeptidase n=1 Tax=Inquilinus sp. CAU 1745 TaxID=3140369 RepID=UPI00325B8977